MSHNEECDTTCPCCNEPAFEDDLRDTSDGPMCRPCWEESDHFVAESDYPDVPDYDYEPEPYLDGYDC